MKSRKFVRRALVVAALVHAPSPNWLSVNVFAADAAAPRAPGQSAAGQSAPVLTGQPAAFDRFGRPITLPTARPGVILPVQFQPDRQAPARSAQPSPQSGTTAQAANPTVVNELNRLFLENGQQPPSMRDQDLPYANSLRTNTIKAKEPAAKKPNLFQKFVGRLRGGSKSSDEPAKPARPGLSSLSAPPPQQSADIGRAPASIQAAPASRTSVTPGASAAPGTSQPGVAQLRNRPRTTIMAPPPAVPPAQLNSVQVNPATAASGVPQPQSRVYVQPGTAPAFMSPGTVAQRPVATQQPAAVSAVPVGQTRNPRDASTHSPAAAAEDGFVNPFSSSSAGIDSEEVLDLDSLIEIPRPAESVSPENDPVPVPVPLQKTVPATTATVDQPLGESRASEAPSNPFTGVNLESSDAEFFRDTAGRASMDDSDGFESDNLPPVEEFDSNLPALPLATPDSAVQINRPDVSADTDAAQSTPNQSSRDRQRQQIQMRAGQTGFKGFCPVQLRDRRELVDADPSLTSTFGLQKYAFSSPDARAAFEADPARYAPAAGGSDVVLLVNSGEEQAGMLDYSLWYKDRLYMFSSRETMTQFSRDPAGFAAQY